MAIPSLVLGSFDLTDWAGGDYGVSVIAEGTSRGTPEPIEAAVKSWLQDGSIVVTQGYDNRTVSLRVRLRGPDLTSLAQAEAALFSELGKPNTLTWTPGDGISPPSVFVVVTSSMEESPSQDGDLSELIAYPWRTYNLRLLCEAFVRSDTEVTAVAINDGTTTSVPAPVSVTVDDGTATTGWTGNYYRYDLAAHLESSGSTTVTVVSGAVKSTTPTSTGPPWVFTSQVEAKKTATIDVSVTKQLVVSWKWDLTGAFDPATARIQSIQLLLNEAGTPVTLNPIGGTLTPARGTLASTTFLAPSTLSTINTLRVVVRIQAVCSGTTFGATTESISIDSVVRNNANQAADSLRQQQRTITVAGSARTQGRVTIAHEVSALGDVLAYFWPDTGATYSPNLRQFRSSGGAVTADTTMTSGAFENIVGSTVVFTIPASQVPEGGYLLMARLGGAATSSTVTWTATTVLNGVDIGPSVTGSRAITLTVAYQNFVLTRIILPTRDVNQGATTASVRISLTATVGTGSTANLDEAWMFNSTIGQLTQVNCGTAAPSSGGSSNRVFIKPATVTSPRPTIRAGFASDESDSASPTALLAWQPPEFDAGVVKCFVVTSNALAAAVTLNHYPRWHTHAAS